MYVYHELIDALSTRMMHINLNTIYTHVVHSPTDAIYPKYRKKQEKVNAMNSDHTYIYTYVTDLYIRTQIQHNGCSEKLSWGGSTVRRGRFSV